jgi:hypothetical protein
VNKVTTLGIDLAKTVFQLHGVDLTGKVVWRREVRRAQLMKFVAQLEPCLIGIEACGGANYWARRFAEFGHQVKMMSPQFVKPPASWSTPYWELASENELGWTTLEELTVAVGAFPNPVLAGQNGTWRPTEWQWS